MWFTHEQFRTRKEAVQYAANKMPADQPKRIKQVYRGDLGYRDGFRWNVQVEQRAADLKGA